MKFKTGIVLGFAAGYVLGAKAGRERYDQIRAMCGNVASHDRIHEVVEIAQEAAESPGSTARSVFGNGLRSASDRLRTVIET